LVRLGASPRPRPFVRVLSIRLSDHATRRYVLERVPDLPMRYEVNVNGRRQTIDVSPDTPLLWVLRETLGLTGTKFGCGVAQCGACTVHLNGKPTRACVTPVANWQPTAANAPVRRSAGAPVSRVVSVNGKVRQATRMD